eukprot:TRINITY_DN107783_c0_g1_i1.p1 TRINITY_DN107783_c0_g1~~TRINITY_DN107783_c0_g1_i1.p1  ORF type:complete len:248 (+),score=60.39 TRINITY_DN107783_c0_g1_i1:106-849(+)
MPELTISASSIPAVLSEPALSCLKPRAAPADIQVLELVLPASSGTAVLGLPAAPRLKPRAAPVDVEISELALPASFVPAVLGVPAAPRLKPTAAPTDMEMPELALPAPFFPAVLGVPAAPHLKPRAAPMDMEMPELWLPASSSTGMEEALKMPRAPLLVASMISECLQPMPALMLPESARADVRHVSCLWSDFCVDSISNLDAESDHASEDGVLFGHFLSNASTDLEGEVQDWADFEASCAAAKLNV